MDTDLDEVKVTVKRVPEAPETLPEITVTAERIPWWVWALAGGVLVTLLIKESKR